MLECPVAVGCVQDQRDTAILRETEECVDYRECRGETRRLHRIYIHTIP